MYKKKKAGVPARREKKFEWCQAQKEGDGEKKKVLKGWQAEKRKGVTVEQGAERNGSAGEERR